MMIFLFTIMLIVLTIAHLMSYKASEKLNEHTKKVLDNAKEIQDNSIEIIKLNKILLKKLVELNKIEYDDDNNKEGIDKLINEL